MCVSLAQALFKTRLCEQQLLSFLAEVFIRPFSQRWPLAPRPLPPVWVHWHSMGVPASFQRLFLLNALEQVPQHLLHLLPAWRQKTNQRKHLKDIKKNIYYIYIYYVDICCIFVGRCCHVLPLFGYSPCIFLPPPCHTSLIFTVSHGKLTLIDQFVSFSPYACIASFCLIPFISILH